MLLLVCLHECLKAFLALVVWRWQLAMYGIICMWDMPCDGMSM